MPAFGCVVIHVLVEKWNFDVGIVGSPNASDRHDHRLGPLNLAQGRHDRRVYRTWLEKVAFLGYLSVEDAVVVIEGSRRA